MKHILSLLLCFMIVGTAHAVPLTNGSFESGLTGWTPAGNAGVVSSYVATNDVASVYTTMSPTNGDKFATVKAGSPTSSLTSSAFTVSLGNIVSFDWFFSAEDYMPFNDFVGFSLDIIYAGGTVAADVLSMVSSVGNWGLTGWNTASFIAPVSGDMTLKFYAVNVGDNNLLSTLGIDNIRVPEPGTLALFGLGLIGVGSRQFFKRNSDPTQAIAA